MSHKDATYSAKMHRWLEAIEGSLYPPDRYVLQPNMKRILNEAHLQGKRVLDAGCGNGRFARYMQDLGAKVFGIDISEEMLAKTSAFILCQYGDVQDIPFRDAIFDVVLCSMVLMSPSIPNYALAFKEIWRILKPSGELVFAIVHPCFESWGINGAFPFARAQDYYTEGSQKWPLRLVDGTTLELDDVHRPLESYFVAMRGLFLAAELWEPRCIDPQAHERYWKGQQYAEIEYLIIKAVKNS
jgi:SAM-dependent methyltransferase